MFSFSSPSSPHRDKNFHLSSCNTTMKFKILIFHFAKNVWLLKFCSLTLLGIFSIYLFFLCMYLSIISVHGTIQICLRSVSRLSKVLYIHDYIQKVLELVNNYISNMFQNCKKKMLQLLRPSVCPRLQVIEGNVFATNPKKNTSFDWFLLICNFVLRKIFK